MNPLRLHGLAIFLQGLYRLVHETVPLELRFPFTSTKPFIQGILVKYHGRI